MASLVIQLEASGIDAALARLTALGQVMATEELADGLGVLMVGQTQRRIMTEKTTPGGQAWKPNQTGTAILVRAGALYDSIDHAVRGAYQVAVGTGIKYARVHQFGAIIRPVNAKALRFRLGGKNVFAKKVTIPAREYLGVSADNATEIEETAKSFIAKVML